jgi:hypothetical protein
MFAFANGSFHETTGPWRVVEAIWLSIGFSRFGPRQDRIVKPRDYAT